MPVAKIWKARKFVPTTVPAIMPSSSKTRRGTSWRFVAGKVRSLRNEQVAANSWAMSNPAHVSANLQEPRRNRYLQPLVLLKICKGVLLLKLGISLLFLNPRSRLTYVLSNWTADEILMEH